MRKVLIDGKALADEILGEIIERGQASGIWEQQLEIGAITYRDIEYAKGYDDAFEDIYRRIDNAPTVEAIPIKWFKKKIDWLFENGIYGAEVYQWILNRWYEDKEYWEKENE